MKLELYYYNQCFFCQSVLLTIEELEIRKKIIFKNILEHDEYRQDLFELCGGTQVPCLVIDGQPLLESKDISSYLLSTYRNT